MHQGQRYGSDVKVPYQDAHSTASTSNILERDRTFKLRMDLQKVYSFNDGATAVIGERLEQDSYHGQFVSRLEFNLAHRSSTFSTPSSLNYP
jgi:hypothetical protein